MKAVSGGSQTSESTASPAGIYLFIVENKNTSTTCEICSTLDVVLASLLLILNRFHALF